MKSHVKEKKSHVVVLKLEPDEARALLDIVVEWRGGFGKSVHNAFASEFEDELRCNFKWIERSLGNPNQVGNSHEEGDK
jgi:hypothetical protein